MWTQGTLVRSLLAILNDFNWVMEVQEIGEGPMQIDVNIHALYTLMAIIPPSCPPIFQQISSAALILIGHHTLILSPRNFQSKH